MVEDADDAQGSYTTESDADVSIEADEELVDEEIDGDDAEDAPGTKPGRKARRKNTTSRQRYRVSMSEVCINGRSFDAPEGLIARPLSHKEALLRERELVPTPLALLEAEGATDLLIKLEAEGEDAAQCASLLGLIESLVFCDRLAPTPRQVAVVTDVSSALEEAGSMGVFKKIFRFSPREVQELAALLLPDGCKCQDKDHRRTMGSQEIMLVVLARFGGYLGTWDQAADFFGSRPDFLSAMFVLAVQDLTMRFEDRLTLEVGAKKFKLRGPEYSAAVSEYMRDSWAGDELHEYYADMRVALDGARQALSRPSDSRLQTSTWSRYTKQNDLDYGVYGTMCGLIMAIVGPVPGRFTDKSFMLADHATVLQVNGLPAVCDAIFAHKPGAFLPIVQERWLQKHDMTKRDNQIASSIRVFIEHTIGGAQARVPFIFNASKNKICVTDVRANFIVGCILYNAHACMHGTQTSLRFRCRPPRFEDWLNKPQLPADEVITFQPHEDE